jgi:hypothetical protein
MNGKVNHFKFKKYILFLELIFDTVKHYESTHDVFGLNPIQNQNHVNGNA